MTLFIPKQSEAVDLFKFYGVKNKFSVVEVPDFKVMKGGGVLRSARMAFQISRKSTGVVYGRDVYTLAFLALMKRRVFLDAHSPLMKKRGLKGVIIKNLLRSRFFGGATVISEALKLIYLEDGLPANKLTVVRNAADPIPIFQAEGGNRAVNRPYTIGYIGHLYQGRGVEIVISLAKNIPEVEVIIVGGTKADIEFWRGNGDDKNITFTGFMPPGEVRDYLKRFDLLVAPYHKQIFCSDGRNDSGGFASPVKLFEYMATGLPILTSRLPVVEEFLSDEEALLCDPDNPDEWSDAVRKCIANPDFARRIGFNALEKLRNNFTWKERVKRIISFLSKPN